MFKDEASIGRGMSEAKSPAALTMEKIKKNPALQALERNKEIGDPGSRPHGRTENELFNLQKLHNTEIALQFANFDHPGMAESVRGRILEILEKEESSLKGLFEDHDESLRVFAERRRLELEKKRIELEMRWLGKEMWELHVPDGDPRKAPLQKKYDDLKNTQLPAIIEQLVTALHSEQNVLVSRSPRLLHIKSQLAKFATPRENSSQEG